ncbi:hypothetical protein PCCS19_48440 [Paenibacillus sp. CCS19]|uniref:hypothetical protein n=1 Tax=Paenibacillus sp. CCS19 TaxID=3158387 RepID=UPI00256548DB|nr:hypothetical protein [Paenibacillus cellulosilyticus]GMK41785.1 hypothetical protein PCCS19_48440 [Paenibacillus cellulosilyticus]
MSFEEAHRAFIEYHLSMRSGERKGRLDRGHLEAEQLFCRKVWWPLMGNFNNLHPEYEVLDWRGISYFCDFVYITQGAKLIFEIKGFGPHVRDMDRRKYCNELNRETFLAAMGFHVISLAYDDVTNRPELCITLLRMVLSRYHATPGIITTIPSITLAEWEIVRLACRLARPIRPIDVETQLRLNHRTAVRMLKSLSDKSVLTAISGPTEKHVIKYAIQQNSLRQLLQGM